MENDIRVKELDEVVVRFSGDSGDGMQLAGNIFSTVSATVGNDISTFPVSGRHPSPAGFADRCFGISGTHRRPQSVHSGRQV